jgi:hypothetical protein
MIELCDLVHEGYVKKEDVNLFGNKLAHAMADFWHFQSPDIRVLTISEAKKEGLLDKTYHCVSFYDIKLNACVIESPYRIKFLGAEIAHALRESLVPGTRSSVHEFFDCIGQQFAYETVYGKQMSVLNACARFVRSFNNGLNKLLSAEHGNFTEC